jgi:hypothetical protein
MPAPQRPSRRRRPINLSRRAFSQLAAALGVVTLLSSARADWSLLTADFQNQQHLTINTWNPQQGLSATSASGKLATIPSRDIVSLDSGRKINDASPRLWKLSLRNGDLLLGEAAGFSGQSLVFITADLGKLAIPLKSIASLSGPRADAAEPAAKPSATEKDLVLLANKDRVEGIVANIDDSKLLLVTDNPDQPLPIPLANISQIYFGGAAAPRSVPPLSVRLSFTSGSTYTVPLSGQPDAFAWTLNNLTIKDPAGTDHPVKIDSIARADVLGGRVVYLSELDPVSEEQTTFLDTSWPMQINKNVLGQPLRIARVDYPRGIGVHTQSTLTYDLDGSFDTLSLRVGLDDSAAPTGEALASISLDGKTLWQSATLKPGQLSPELSLPIKGGHRLQLTAAPAAHLDVLGRLDWLNVALLRK